MAPPDDPPERPEPPAMRRWDERQDSGDLVSSYRRRREYEEVTALLRALRAANFDLGDPETGDDERMLTKMLQDWRDRYERRQRQKTGAAKFGKWVVMAIGGAIVTLFGPDAHTWLRSHWP